MKKLSKDEISKLNAKDAKAKVAELQAFIESMEASAGLSTDVAELQKTVLDQEKLIAELSTELESKGGSALSVDTVEVDGKEYRIAIPKFKHLGVEKNASDLKDDADLCRALIKRGSGVLKAK